jgi:hypothetical protein
MQTSQDTTRIVASSRHMATMRRHADVERIDAMIADSLADLELDAYYEETRAEIAAFVGVLA